MPNDPILNLLRSLSAQPHAAESWAEAGRMLREFGEIEGAVTCLARAAALASSGAGPRHALAEGGAGAARALAEARKELQIAQRRNAAKRPWRAPRETLARLLAALGTTLSIGGPFDTAAALLKRATAIEPKLAVAHALLGAVLIKAQQVDEGLAALRRALDLDPGDAASRLNLGTGLVSIGRHAEGIEALQRAVALRPADASYRSRLLFHLPFAPKITAGQVLEEAREWDRRHGGGANDVRSFTNDRSPQRRLRIGYVSPDFRHHCQRFFVVPLFTHHDRESFEIIAYSSVPSPDDVTARVRGLVSQWRDIAGLDDAAAAARIVADRVDILVDLTMHMDGNRLPIFARKPAPVRVTWLAYPGTTGLSAIDYRLTDVHLDPPELGTDSLYAEQSVRLPETFWCYDPLVREPEPGPLPALAEGSVTFGCLNNFCKTNDGVLAVWAQVVRQVEGARLLLLAPPGQARRRTIQTLERLGVTPDRIVFEGARPHAEYLALYRRVDIALDPFPYNGHTTSLDALWMGVPVVTLVGPTVVGRAGLSQAKNLGVMELVARTPDEYVRIALDLARDTARLVDLRATLRARMEQSPLMDAPRFARNLEAAYRTMWRRWCGRTLATPHEIA
jgi:protein O-GlcNAc transferase